MWECKNSNFNSHTTWKRFLHMISYRLIPLALIYTLSMVVVWLRRANRYMIFHLHWAARTVNVGSRPKKSKLRSVLETNVIYQLLTVMALDFIIKFATVRWLREFVRPYFSKIYRKFSYFMIFSRKLTDLLRKVPEKSE